MANKEEGSSVGAGKVARKGRPPSKRAKQFSWYGRLTEFETGADKPWWDKIEWEDEKQARKGKRSDKPRQSFTSRVHPGFLWEALRRYPETQRLNDAMGYLSSDASIGKSVDLKKVIGIQQGMGQLLNDVGLNVVGALEVLRKNWQHPFDRIPKEPMGEWMAFYLDLWHQIGERGSVPTKPPDTQDHEEGIMAGQDKAAFDLLIDMAPSDSCSDFGGPFVDLPLPNLFLKTFAKLRPYEKYDEKFNSFAPGKTNPITYPWLSFGILKRRLKTFQMHPMALAVDLSKSTDTIMRDLKILINEKRRLLGVAPADRRLRKESFEKIHQLDNDVRTRAENTPLSRTVKEFESAAKLDLSSLLALVETIRDQSSMGDSRNVNSIIDAIDYVKSNPLSQLTMKGSKKEK